MGSCRVADDAKRVRFLNDNETFCKASRLLLVETIMK